MRILSSDVNPKAAETLPSGGRAITIGGAALGLVAFGIAALSGSWPEFLRAYLVSFAFTLSLTLGCLVFVLIQHITGSAWSVTVRRLAEAVAATVAVLAVLFIPLAAGINALYHWAHPDDELLVHKSGWLNPTFFVIRAAVYFGIWILSTRFLLRTSRAQDENGDPRYTLKLRKWSPLIMLLYGLTITYAAFDLFMSTEPHWYSTVFGAYYFGGSVTAGFAVMILLAFFLQRTGRLKEEITVEHYHDLGKQMFGWNVFWSYIAFCQFMLIWVANIPEEVLWFKDRLLGPWKTLAWVLLVGHFAIPFLLLLPRKVKRTPALLAAMAGLLLVMHWIDCFWVLAPAFSHGEHAASFGAAEILTAVGHLAFFAAGVAFALGSGALLPAKDPFLGESLAFENL